MVITNGSKGETGLTISRPSLYSAAEQTIYLS